MRVRGVGQILHSEVREDVVRPPNGFNTSCSDDK